MHFVIDNQPPIIAGEEREMREILFCCLLSTISMCLLFASRTTVRENLVGADGNGTDFFAISRVLTYHLRWDIRLVENFLYPLPYRYGIGRKDQRGALNIGHGD